MLIIIPNIKQKKSTSLLRALRMKTYFAYSHGPCTCWMWETPGLFSSSQSRTEPGAQWKHHSPWARPRSIPGCHERVLRGSWARGKQTRPAAPTEPCSLGGEEAEISPSGWRSTAPIHISALHDEKSVSAQGQQRLYLPPRVPASLSVMIIKPCQQIWNQWTQLCRQALRKPPRRPCSQVFVIHLENCRCHKSF